MCRRHLSVVIAIILCTTALFPGLALESKSETVKVVIKRFDPDTGLTREVVGKMNINEALELKHEIESILLAPSHPNEKMESILLLLEKDFPELTCSLKGELRRLARLNPVDAVLNPLSVVIIFTLSSLVAIGMIPVYCDYFEIPPWGPINIMGYNLSLLLELSICLLIAPVYGFGSVLTAGLFGIQAIPFAGFIGFLLGFAGIWLAFEFGTPPESLFELCLGVCMLPVFASIP